MKKGEYDEYEYIEGNVVMQAVFGDYDALLRIYNRYMGNIVDCIVSTAREKGRQVQTLPMEDLKQSIWCDLIRDISGYRPK